MGLKVKMVYCSPNFFYELFIRVTALKSADNQRLIVIHDESYCCCLDVRGNPHEDALFSELFFIRQYNRLTHPVADLSETTHVQFGLVLQKIVQVVSNSELASVHLIIVLVFVASGLCTCIVYVSHYRVIDRSY